MSSEDDKRKQREAEQLKQSNAEADAALKKQSITDAIAHDEKRPGIEKRRRAQVAANTDEAIRKRNSSDPWTGE